MTAPKSGLTGRTPDDGGRIWRHPTEDFAKIRPGNKMIRDVPPADRELQIFCYDGAATGRGHLVAVVDGEWKLQARNHPAASTVAGALHVLCRCDAAEHLLSIARVQNAINELRISTPNRRSRRRKLDVRSVAPTEHS